MFKYNLYPIYFLLLLTLRSFLLLLSLSDAFEFSPKSEFTSTLYVAVALKERHRASHNYSKTIYKTC